MSILNTSRPFFSAVNAFHFITLVWRRRACVGLEAVTLHIVLFCKMRETDTLKTTPPFRNGVSPISVRLQRSHSPRCGRSYPAVSPASPPSSRISPFPISLCELLLKHNVLIEGDRGFPSITTSQHCHAQCWWWQVLFVLSDQHPMLGIPCRAIQYVLGVPFGLAVVAWCYSLPSYSIRILTEVTVPGTHWDPSVPLRAR